MPFETCSGRLKVEVTLEGHSSYIGKFDQVTIENKSTASGAKYARSSVIFPHRMAFIRGRLMQ